jgi:hypothetical protein
MVRGYSESNITSSFFPGPCLYYGLTGPVHHLRKPLLTYFIGLVATGVLMRSKRILSNNNGIWRHTTNGLM